MSQIPNSHGNSSLMRLQNETVEKVKAVADHERRAANAQLALMVDEWMVWSGYEVLVDPSVKPARTTTPARPVPTLRRVAPATPPARG